MKAQQIAKVKEIYRNRNCAYCGWLASAVSWWCRNAEIVKMRGTAIPGVCHCPGWKPDKNYIIELIKEI